MFIYFYSVIFLVFSYLAMFFDMIAYLLIEYMKFETLDDVIFLQRMYFCI